MDEPVKTLRDRQLGTFQVTSQKPHCSDPFFLFLSSSFFFFFFFFLLVALSTATVLEMLHLGSESQPPKISVVDEVADESVSWKVLVYDKFGCDVIAPLLKVGELRENGVTLHL